MSTRQLPCPQFPAWTSGQNMHFYMFRFTFLNWISEINVLNSDWLRSTCMCGVALFLHLLLRDGIFNEVLTFFKYIYIYFFVAQLVPLTYSSAHPGAHQIFINAERLESNTPIRPFWKSKSPSWCTPLSAGQRLLLCYWSLHRRRGGGAGLGGGFFNFYRVSSSTPPK